MYRRDLASCCCQRSLFTMPCSMRARLFSAKLGAQPFSLACCHLLAAATEQALHQQFAQVDVARRRGSSPLFTNCGIRLLTSGTPRYHHLDADTSLLSARDILPAPMAADLNGDGRVEVVAVTHTGQLQARLCKSRSCLGDKKAVWISLQRPCTKQTNKPYLHIWGGCRCWGRGGRATSARALHRRCCWRRPRWCRLGQIWRTQVGQLQDCSHCPLVQSLCLEELQ